MDRPRTSSETWYFMASANIITFLSLVNFCDMVIRRGGGKCIHVTKLYLGVHCFANLIARVSL